MSEAHFRRIAVTGATGHLGIALVRELIHRYGPAADAGRQLEIRLIMRRPMPPEELQRLVGASAAGAGDRARGESAGDDGATGGKSATREGTTGRDSATGDGGATRTDLTSLYPRIHFVPVVARLDDRASLERAVAGCEVVFGAAGRVSIGSKPDPELARVNTEGALNVAAACAVAGVGRLVHVASIEAFALSHGRYPITEERGLDPAHTLLAYGRSKADAALEIQKMALRRELDAVILCPTGFIGPFDYRLSPMGRMVLDFMHRKLPAYVRGGFDFVDVRDVAASMPLAAEKGHSGEIYLIGGEYVDVPRLMTLLESVAGVPAPRLCLPAALIAPFIPFVEMYYRRRNISPRFTRDSLALLGLGVTVSTEKARRELGYSPRPVEESLRDTVDWFRACFP